MSAADVHQLIGKVRAEIEEMKQELLYLRKRLHQVYPEPHHCPNCYALVSATATHCMPCGHSWGERVDSKMGLPKG